MVAQTVMARNPKCPGFDARRNRWGPNSIFRGITIQQFPILFDYRTGPFVIPYYTIYLHTVN